MADIKQAADWMDEGHSVTRKGMRGWYVSDSRGHVRYCDPDGILRYDATIDTGDLRGDDWEIAE